MATSGTVKVDTIETAYCSNCYLATPTWKGRCIHCKSKLPTAFDPIKKSASLRGNRYQRAHR